MKPQSFFYAIIWLVLIIFNGKAHTSANDRLSLLTAIRIDTIRSYELYNSPVFEIAEHFFSDKNRWKAPAAGSDDITYFGPPVSQKTNAISAVMGFVYDRVHIAAENNIYAKSLAIHVDLAHEKLSKGKGVLLKYNTYYNTEGQTNLYSVDNVQSMGVGTSPEEALANQPLLNIRRNDYSTSYPTLRSHYVFLFKNKKGNIEISRIVAPFKNQLEEKASALKTTSLQNLKPIVHYSDENIRAFDRAQAWQKNYDQHKSNIDNENAKRRIQFLINEMKTAQAEFFDLQEKLVNAQGLTNALGTMISFVDACADISTKFNQNSTGLQKEEKALYESQKKHTDNLVSFYLPKITESKKKMQMIEGQLRQKYLKEKLPEPKV